MANVTASPATIRHVRYWYRTNYVGFAGFTVLLWDHIDTFTAEVELIWMRDKSPLTCLFLFNRYLIPLGFIINLFAYLHSWTYESCKHFIRYEGAMTMIGISVVEIMMFLRIHAIYRHQKWVWYGVGLLFVIQTAVNAWLLTHGKPVPHWDDPDDPVRACTMIFDEKLGAIANASAWLPLLYDTVVFVLTAIRVLPRTRPYSVSMSELNKRLFEGGMIYYSAIFGVTLVLTIMIPLAPDGLKNITAQLQLLLTVTMMSRITLNLKKAGRKGFVHNVEVSPQSIRFAKPKIPDLEQVHRRDESDSLDGCLKKYTPRRSW